MENQQENLEQKSDSHYCSKCGAIISEADTICPNCGLRFEQTITAEQPFKVPLSENEIEIRSRFKFYFWGSVLVSVFFLLYVFIFARLVGLELLNRIVIILCLSLALLCEVLYLTYIWKFAKILGKNRLGWLLGSIFIPGFGLFTFIHFLRITRDQSKEIDVG